jgi:peptidoglycan/LPS O-acetylase OafA/YrhL
MSKAKVLEFEIFRAFAIIAVVLIHSSAEGWGMTDPHSKLHLFFGFLNKMSNFAVPAFIFMSGVVLFYTYYTRWQAKDIIKFYAKRLKFIVVPYIVVSLVYYLYNQQLFLGKMTFNLSEFLNLLPWADAGYHLYFIIIIVQFYLLFPLLLFCAKKFPLIKRHFTLIGIVLFLVFYIINKFYYAFEHKPSLCFTYFIFFFLGASIGMNYSDALTRMKKYRWAITIITLLSGLGLWWLYVLAGYKINLSNYLFDLSFNMYGAFASMSIILLAYVIHRNYAKLSSVFQSIGGHSFGIYLIHPALLSTFRLKVPASGGTLHYLLNFVGSFLVAFAGAYILTILIKRLIKPYWILIGK